MNVLLEDVELSVLPSGKALDTVIGSRLFTWLDGGRVLLMHLLLLLGSLVGGRLFVRVNEGQVLLTHSLSLPRKLSKCGNL